MPSTFPFRISGPLILAITLIGSMLGFYHVQSARYASDPIEKMFSFVKAAGEYSSASSKYPEDDELRACELFPIQVPLHTFYNITYLFSRVLKLHHGLRAKRRCPY
jgi:hypothetical protein